jgi:hypothetical protein
VPASREVTGNAALSDVISALQQLLHRLEGHKPQIRSPRFLVSPPSPFHKSECPQTLAQLFSDSHQRRNKIDHSRNLDWSEYETDLFFL